MRTEGVRVCSPRVEAVGVLGFGVLGRRALSIGFGAVYGFRCQG